MYVIQDIRKYTAKVRTSTDISFVLITRNTSFYSYKLFLDYLVPVHLDHSSQLVQSRCIIFHVLGKQRNDDTRPLLSFLASY